MKKKIVALLATIAAVFGFGFASSTAMADDYSMTTAPSGNVATVAAPANTFTANEAITVTYDTTYVSDVVSIAVKTVYAKADGSLTLKYILTDAGIQQANAGGFTITAVGAESGSTFTTTVKDDVAPQTGAPSGDANADDTTADTGAAIAPYGIAIMLMIAAGVALFAVRKKANR